MEKKKQGYETEIAAILRKTMEISYLRKKNRQNTLALLKAVESYAKEGAPQASPLGGADESAEEVSGASINVSSEEESGAEHSREAMDGLVEKYLKIRKRIMSNLNAA